MKHILAIFLIILFTFPAHGQNLDSLEGGGERDRRAVIEAKLAELSALDPTYLTEVDISVGRQSLPELLRSVAGVAKVNLMVKGAESISVTCNFSRAKITDLIRFLCKEYNLEIDIVGNIVAISPVVPPPPPPVAPKQIGVSHRIATNSLSFDLSGDRLGDVTRRITDLTGTNFFLPQSLSEQRLSGYVKDMPFDEAVRSIAAMNGLEAAKDDGRVWSFYVAPNPAAGEQQGIGSAPLYQRRMPFSPTELSIDSLGTITAQIGRGSIQDIITDLAEQQRLNYFFASPVDGQTSIWVREVDFETLLDVMLAGTEFSYYIEEGVWIFGAGGAGGAGGTGGQQNTLTAVEVVGMKNRSVNEISKIIPEAIKRNVQVQEFADLNGIVLSGERRSVSRVRNFLRSIDRRVPLVTIEVMIVDATKQRVMDVGIDAGFGKSGVQSGGSLAGIDVTLNAAGVNSLINSFNGFGSVNLGKVGSGFYLSLQFLEDNGVIEIASTPKLSTLNGHEATLTSGETRYYKEMANNYYGSQITMATESYVWKSIDANLEIKITPFVSEDRHITLDISIDQTEFTAREEEDAPPGTATRSFKSLIRVQNEEMVLLGGIDQNVREKSNRGLPWIARVPVLKWFFGKGRDSKKEHRLNVFIKPTLVE